MEETNHSELSGIQKAAILLVGLGPEVAVEVFKRLTDVEIDRLTVEISNLQNVRKGVVNQVLDEFYELVQEQNLVGDGGLNFAKKILEEALGEEKAMGTIGRLTNRLQGKPFQFARRTDPSQIFNVIQHEHPQTIALVLSYLEPNQASHILAHLPEDKQAEVAKRIALMERTSPEVIHHVEQVLERKLSVSGVQDYTETGGVESIVRVLSQVDRGTEKTILTNLEKDHPELVEEIKKRMFVFEDIVKLDSMSMQRVIREVTDTDLIYALKVANEDVKSAIFKNMSSRRAESIQDELEIIGPVKLKDVEDAQSNIVNIIRELDDQGEIIIGGEEGDEVVV